MADNTTVHIGENSPEQAAYKLLQIVAGSEGKKIHPNNANADREWLLDAYAECLQAVKGYRDWEK